MRRFEYRDGKSSKFWMIAIQDSEVHLRWGRMGTEGQTKTKQAGSAEQAQKEAEKQIASKLKKGYQEVTPQAVEPPPPDSRKPQPEPAPAPSPPVEELPDESRVMLPAAWLRQVAPRQGGEVQSGTSLATEKKAREQGRKALGNTYHLRSLELEEAFLEEKLSPQKAGLAVACSQTGHHARRSLIDVWLRQEGITGAVDGFFQTWKAVGSSSLRPDYGWYRDMLWRLRTHLALASPDDYAEARSWMERERSRLEEPLLLFSAFLFPTEPEWLWNSIDLTERHLQPYKWLAASDLETAQYLVKKHGPLVLLFTDPQPLPTVLQTLQNETFEFVELLLHRPHLNDSLQETLNTALACFPLPEAFHHLIDRQSTPGGLQALQTALTNFPRLALKELAGRPKETKWLSFLLKEYPEARNAVWDDLDAEQQAQVELLEESGPKEAPLRELPRWLATPAWETSKASQTARLDLKPAELSPSVSWKDGQKASWACRRQPEQGDQGWQEFLARLAPWRRNPLHWADYIGWAPERAAREMLQRWQPEDPWYVSDKMRQVVARFELEALPALKHYASKSLKDAVGCFGPLRDPDLALLACEAFGRLKSARSDALDYLVAHPANTTLALLPQAFGKAKKLRNWAQRALLQVAESGHREVMLESAGHHYGNEAMEALRNLLDRDPMEQHPNKMPTLPDWFDPIWVKRPELKNSGEKLPDEAVRNLALMAAISNPDEIYPGLERAREICTAPSLTEFAWSLFELWLKVGAPSKENWAFQGLGWLGSDEVARRLTPMLKRWPGEGGHARAVQGLQILCDIGSDVALMHLYGLSQKLKFKGLKKAAGEKVQEVAEARGLSTHQLGDRLVPDLDLDERGSTVLDYGPRRFTVGFDEQLKPFVKDEQGKILKNLPKPGKRDDEGLALPAYERFKAIKKDVRAVAKQQLVRLELAMCLQRRWPAGDFRRFFLEHPLLVHLVRRLVWAVYADGEPCATFRVAEDDTLADQSDDEWTLPDEVEVGIPHPIELDRPTLGAWGEVFSDYELLQPFEQLSRSVFLPTARERQSEELSLVKGQPIAGVRVLGLESRGWRKGETLDGGVIGWMIKELPDDKIAFLGLNPGLVVGDPNAFGDLTLEEVTLGDTADSWEQERLYSFEAISEVAYSELVRDLETLRFAAQPA